MRAHLPLVVVLVAVGILAVGTHRRGIGWGDDYTLYLRQARSLFDGNIGQVIADNHDNVLLAAKPGFSPFVYPWGWPLVLAPFVRLFGLDYERLKVVEVGCWLVFLGFFHAVLRRRMIPWLAIGTVAAIGTSMPYLRHTGQLLSEFPYLAFVAATLWWLDRCRRGGRLDLASRRDLVVLGLLAMMVFNTRREGLAIVPAIVAVQLVDLRGRWNVVAWKKAATPVVTFVVSVVALQLVVPSALAPRYEGAGLHHTWRKLGGPFRTAFRDQLAIGEHSTLAWVVFAVVIIGVAYRLVRATADDVALVVFPLLSVLIVGTIPANGDRYLLPITPFAVYFAAQAAAQMRRPRSRKPLVAGCAIATMLLVHIVGGVDEVRAARAFNDAGVTQDGPASPYAIAAFDAIERYTRRNDIVAFFKARALTFYTDRRAVQSSDFQVIRQRADFFMMRRDSSHSQPLLTDSMAADAGLVEVWSDPDWVLWKIPPYDD